MDKRIKQAINSGRRVVDLGCGSGYMLADLGDQFDERIGLDVSRRRLDDENKPVGWTFQEADLNASFPLKNECVDAVIANQVIEHIVNPVNFVSEIYRILLPRGRCVITTPNIRYFPHIVHLLLSGSGPRTGGVNKLDGEWDDGHLHYFTHKDLRDLFLSVGFSEVQSRALINEPERNLLRRTLDFASFTHIVRELLSGNILLWGIK